MDGTFLHPLRLSSGETIVTLTSAQEAGAFLLANWPPRRRRPKSYRLAIEACIRAIGGSAESETARAAFLLALADLSGGKATAGRSRRRAGSTG